MQKIADYRTQWNFVHILFISAYMWLYPLPYSKHIHVNNFSLDRSNKVFFGLKQLLRNLIPAIKETPVESSTNQGRRFILESILVDDVNYRNSNASAIPMDVVQKWKNPVNVNFAVTV
jgi:hypothetical protein